MRLCFGSFVMTLVDNRKNKAVTRIFVGRELLRLIKAEYLNGKSPRYIYQFMNGERELPAELQNLLVDNKELSEWFDQFIKRYISSNPECLLRDLVVLIQSDNTLARNSKEYLLQLSREYELSVFVAKLFIFTVDSADNVEDKNKSSRLPEKQHNLARKSADNIEENIDEAEQNNPLLLNKPFPFNNLPDKPSSYFKGREDEIKAIYDCFRPGESVSLTQTISGLGGIGKTQVALKYAHSYAAEYEVIWWIVAENIEDIYKSILEFVKRKGLFKENDNAVILGDYLGWFENNSSWLLIYDNVEDFQMLRQFLPKNNNGNILITTRATQGYIGKKIDIGLFTAPVAASFLQERTGINDETNAALLAQRLGYLPLALELAAAYIAVAPDMDFEIYLSRLKDSALPALDDGAPLTDYYKHTVRAAWEISLAKITMESARQLLNLCAYFAPDDIPLSVFIRATKACPDYVRHGLENISKIEPDEYLPVPLRSELLDEFQRRKIIMELTKYSLMKYEKGVLSIHRLLQEVVRENLKDSTISIKQCFELISIMGNLQINSYDDLCIYLPHFVSIFDHYNKAFIEKRNLYVERITFNQLGLMFMQFSDYERAIECFTNIMKYNLLLYDDPERNMILTRRHLGDAYRRLGDYKSALDVYNEALDSCIGLEGVLEYFDLIEICCDNAEVYLELGDSNMALEWYKKGLDYRAFETLERTVEGIVRAYRKAAERYRQCAENLRDTRFFYAIVERVIKSLFGQNSSEMTDFLYEVININKHGGGDVDLAFRTCCRLLETREKILAPDHKEILALRAEITAFEQCGYECWDDDED